MGSCPTIDDGEDENGNRRTKKDGIDSAVISPKKFYDFEGYKICIERE